MKTNNYWAAVARTLAVVTLALIVIVVFASSVWAAEYKVLYKFKGGVDGVYPTGALTLDDSGNLYGTTQMGGAQNGGTVFKLSRDPSGRWRESVLYSFSRGTDGDSPPAGVICDTAGNLYGTTSSGGAFGLGTIFRLTHNPDGSWTESLLYSFSGDPDGGSPGSNVVFDSSGNLYGTTVWGGVSGLGTVFKLAPGPDGTWIENVLHSFSGSDGEWPWAGVVFDPSGNLYGTTWGGGAHNWSVVYKLAPNPDGSWTQTVLHNFSYGDGGGSFASLLFDTAGNLFGTTWSGGKRSQGVVFQLSPNPDSSWTEQVIRYFGGHPAMRPFAGLVRDAAGNLYGTTEGDYASGNYGTIFKLARNPDGNWTPSKLHRFNGRGGARPLGGLILDSAGNLYGTTVYDSGGGCYGYGCGVVFKITP